MIKIKYPVKAIRLFEWPGSPKTYIVDATGRIISNEEIVDELNGIQSNGCLSGVKRPRRADGSP